MFEAQVTTEGQKWVLEQNLGIVWSLYGQHFAPTPELLSQQPDNYSTLSCCIRRKENELWRPPYSGTAGIVLRAGMRYRVENWVMGGSLHTALWQSQALPHPAPDASSQVFINATSSLSLGK